MSRFAIPKQEELEAPKYIRKSFTPLTVQKVKLSTDGKIESSNYGAYVKAFFTAVEPTEGLENPESGNCQRTNELFSLSSDEAKGLPRTVKRLGVLADKLGQYAEFEKVLVAVQNEEDDAKLVAALFGFFTGKEFALLVSKKIQVNAEGKVQNNAYINFGRSWCRAWTKEGVTELETELKDNESSYIWDTRPVEDEVDSAQDTDDSGW